MAYSTTSTMNDTTAAHTVSATYELLENVLLHLPMFDVLNAKLVSKQWKAVIESSLPLKKALFLTCDPNECIGHGEGAVPRFDNPFPITLQHRDLQILPVFIDAPSKSFWEYIWEYKPSQWTSQCCSRPEPPASKKENTTYRLNLPREAETGLRGTIWLDMFLSQPPCKAVVLRVHVVGFVSEKVVRAEGGVRLGQVMDELEKILRDDENRLQRRDWGNYRVWRSEVIIPMV